MTREIVPLGQCLPGLITNNAPPFAGTQPLIPPPASENDLLVAAYAPLPSTRKTAILDMPLAYVSSARALRNMRCLSTWRRESLAKDCKADQPVLAASPQVPTEEVGHRVYLRPRPPAVRLI